MRQNKGFYLMILLLLVACDRSYIPKPEGYLRVQYPERSYTLFDTDAPFTFEYPVYAVVVPNRSKITEPYWYDINFPVFKGTIYLSYKEVHDNIDELIEDTRTLVYKHTSRADGIDEKIILDTTHRRFGILYDLDGNVASPVQFFLTDSTENFIRGSLYFRTTPNRDSLNPVINFVHYDIEHMLETLRWK